MPGGVHDCAVTGMEMGGDGMTSSGGGCGDPRDDLERYPGGRTRLSFLPSATEHERIAALEANDRPARPGVLHEHTRDVLLRDRYASAPFTDHHPLGVLWRVLQQTRIGQ